MSNPLYVTCRSGLCNRLRVLLPYMQVASTSGETLVFQWDINEHCAGHFNDFFEALPNVEFGPGKGIDTWSTPSVLEPEVDFQYRDLRLLPEIKALVRQQFERFEGPYMAVHVRRTDLDRMLRGHSWRYEKVETFFSFLNTDDSPFWLACDHKDTQSIFSKRFGKRALFQPIETTSKNRRQTGLQESIIDLYMCINSHSFAGTPYSSFSEFIRQHVNLLSVEERRKLIQP